MAQFRSVIYPVEADREIVDAKGEKQNIEGTLFVYLPAAWAEMLVIYIRPTYLCCVPSFLVRASAFRSAK